MSECACGHAEAEHFGPFGDCMADANPERPDYEFCACQGYREPSDG